MDIVKDPEKDDVVFEKDGLNVFVQKDTDYLFPDATIDFSDDYGFMITGQHCSCS